MNVEKINLVKQNSKIEAAKAPRVQRANLSDAAKDTVTLSSKPAFTGREFELIKFLPGQKTLNKLKSVDWLQGELGGILLTALGTGAVAPFSIAFNPFTRAPKGASEEEKKKVSDTKKYTALRQPVSAMTAIFCQTPIQKVLDKWLDAQVNKPEYSKYFSIGTDHSVLNTSSYLEGLQEKELQEAFGIKKPFILSFKKRNKYNDIVKYRAGKASNAQVEKLAQSFLETGKIKIHDRILDNNMVAQLINENINDYIKDAKALEVDGAGRAFYLKRAQVLMDNEQHLREIFGNTERFPNNKAGFEALDNYLKGLLETEPNKDVKTLIQEVLDKPMIEKGVNRKPVNLRISRMNRTLERIDSIKAMCGDQGFSQAVYHNSLLEKNKLLERIIGKLEFLKIDIPKAKGTMLSDDVISQTIKKLTDTCSFDNRFLSSILHDTKTFNSDKTKLAKKIHKDIIKHYKETIKHRFKASSQELKVFTGIFTMIITCDILNWVYPRFMNLFFPKLAGVKKAQSQVQEGGNK